MNRVMFSIILLAVLGNLCIARIAKNTMRRYDFFRLYKATVDIAMTCYGDPGNAIGIVGNTDDILLEALRSKYFKPVVLINNRTDGLYKQCDNARAHKLQVFIIAVHSLSQFMQLLFELNNHIWWNCYANFLIVDARPELSRQCSSIEMFMHIATDFGMLNTQFICHYHEEGDGTIVIWTSNPFTNWAPKVWSFITEYKIGKRKDRPPGSLFLRMYREGGSSCQSINFPKTRNAGGFPLHILTPLHPKLFQRDYSLYKGDHQKVGDSKKMFIKWILKEHRWFIDNIANALNVTVVITNKTSETDSGIYLEHYYLSFQPTMSGKHFDRMIMRLDQWPMFAVTQHTAHMTQLEKILSVIDSSSRMGMILVYLITFLFFKFFLCQAVTPALLNLVRLTCNMGLTRLPQNVAPTIYLACLFMFVVTLQAIYTGNLATLLTTTIPYPNVQKKADIPKWGYTVYVNKDTNVKLTADPILDGRVIEIPFIEKCIEYVLSDPLAVCVMDYQDAIREANAGNLHVSRDPIIYEYEFYPSTVPNLFKRRVEEVLRRLFEGGLYRPDPAIERLRLQFVDDDEVKRNTDRRVMTLKDLSFAFVILGVGLLCSLICFIGEIVVFKIHLKNVKRNERVRVRQAWGVTAKKCLSFPSLNCRPYLRRLFSNRR